MPGERESPRSPLLVDAVDVLIPIRLDVTTARAPITNWAILAITAFCFYGIDLEAPAPDFQDDVDPLAATLHPLVAQGWGPGLIGHVFLHASFLHLAGNAVFLWVFGNAVCAALNPPLFLATYFGLGLVAISVHLVLVGTPAVGASGAISGLVGMCIIWYPRERVTCLLHLGMFARTFDVAAWTLIIAWFLCDVAGAILGAGNVAYIGHIAGTLAGAGWALALLKTDWVTMPSYQATLLDIRWRR